MRPALRLEGKQKSYAMLVGYLLRAALAEHNHCTTYVALLNTIFFIIVFNNQTIKPWAALENT
ncbi:MAG: hypothetical protein DSZ28_07130 [Thiothrix sp.]|nr:MAG: hypothetical protein DSZ28_07130 [Thiothrix sp.]